MYVYDVFVISCVNLVVSPLNVSYDDNNETSK